jgi:hypothetical protein
MFDASQDKTEISQFQEMCCATVTRKEISGDPVVGNKLISRF